MKLLHVDASIQGDESVSRRLSAAAVARLSQAHPGAQVARRDLARTPIPHLTLEEFGAARGAPVAAGGEAEAARNAELLEEFLAADVVVIGAPMYNFSVPSQLKAWLDRIVVAGRTFAYGPEGPKGLAGGKRVILALSRGGLYGPGSPAAAAEHVESYLRALFGFIGAELEVILAEGVMAGPDLRERALAQALGAASELRAA